MFNNYHAGFAGKDAGTSALARVNDNPEPSHESLIFQVPCQNLNTKLHSHTERFYERDWQMWVRLGKVSTPDSIHPSDHVSFFVKCLQATYDLHDLHFIIQNVNHSNNFVLKTSRAFTTAGSDWGYEKTISLSTVLDPKAGYLQNGSITFEVKIFSPRADDTNINSMYTHSSYSMTKWKDDSRERTGQLGLKNSGATCYLNALLQSLFHTNAFRKAVFSVPIDTASQTAEESIPYALQRLFFKLQFANKSVSTKELTKSFGWSQTDAFIQQDAQELDRVLCDKLENRMKGTVAEKKISGLFEGSVYSYIKCINVEYESSRVEPFYDLSLDIKGCSNLYESFDQYTSEELLDGDNQYKAEKFGYQDAKKGVKFRKLPPILHCHLKRFEFDFETESQIKINDKYEYYSTIDLDKYLDTEADRTVPQKYRLHSVLIHSGDVHGGHYYAYIRPNHDGEKWYKFDDDTVDEVSEKDAIEENYGGETEMAFGGAHRNYWGNLYGTRNLNTQLTRKIKKSANAYMLIYIREADYPDIMAPVEKEDIPVHLYAEFKREQVESKKKKALDERQKNQVLLKVASVNDLAVSSQPFTMINWNAITPIEFEKNSNLNLVADDLVSRNLIASPDVVFWRQESSSELIKPSSCVKPHELDQSLAITTAKKALNRYNNYSGTNYNTYNMWDSMLSSDSELDFPDEVFAHTEDPVMDDDVAGQEKSIDLENLDIPVNQYLLALPSPPSHTIDPVLLIVKQYNSELKSLEFKGFLTFERAQLRIQLESKLRHLLNVDDDVDLTLVLETGLRKYEQVDPTYFCTSSLDSSAVLVVQIGPAATSVVEFYDNLCRYETVEIFMMDPYHSTHYYGRDEKSLGKLELDLTSTYDEVTRKISASFPELSKFLPQNLLLYPGYTGYSTYPAHFPALPETHQTLKHILTQKTSLDTGSPVLFVKPLPFDRSLESQMKAVSIITVGKDVAVNVYDHSKLNYVFVPKDGKGSDLRRSIKQKLGLSDEETRPSKMIVFREYHDTVGVATMYVKKFEVVDQDSQLPPIQSSYFVQLFTEPVPSSSVPVLVRHMTEPISYSVHMHTANAKGWVNFYHHPCYVFVNRATTAQEVLEQALRQIGMNPSDKSLNGLVIRKLQFANQYALVGNELEMNDLVMSSSVEDLSDVFIALQHEQGKSVASHYRYVQKGIVIKDE
ncbi:hypothetical protein RCL1_001518 [Eukaryota sp. TZLM3-RCL]